MKLEDSLIRLSDVERRIYDQGGELTPLTEEELTASLTEVTQNVNAVCFAYKNRQQELETLKQLYRGAIETRKAQLKNFKEVIQYVVETNGEPLKTEAASISMRERKTKQVVIFNFDKVMQLFPSAVRIEDDDNVRKITINKTMLKQLHAEQDGTGDTDNGFEIRDNVTRYADIRIRAKKKTALDVDPDNS